MNLRIARSQKKGMIGKVSFEVTATILTTPEENELIKHYGMGDLVLPTKKRVDILGHSTNDDVTVTAKQLLEGDGYKCKNLGEVVSYEDEIKEAFSALNAYMEMAATFVGVTDYAIEDGEVKEVED